MTITLYWLNSSRASRIIWLLEELKLDYEVQAFYRTPDFLAPPELKEIHPLGKSPVLDDAGRRYAESAFIVKHLIQKHGADSELIPKSQEDQEKVEYLLHYGEGTLMAMIVNWLVLTKIKSSPMPFFIRPIANRIADAALNFYPIPNIRLNLNYLEDELKASDTGYFVGDSLTGADVLLFYPLESLEKRKFVSEARYPHIIKFINTVRSRPAYKKAMEKDQALEAKKPVSHK